MAAPINKSKFTQDINAPIKAIYGGGLMFSKDNLSNVISVNIVDNGQPFEVTGTVVGNVIRSDGTTVPVNTGAISGNTVSLTLTEACFDVPGQIVVNIIVTNGDVKCCILRAVYTVVPTETSAVVDPGDILPSIADLINDIDAAVASIPADYSGLLASIAGTFSPSKPYVAGEYVWYDGTLYRFTAAHAAGSWTGSDATEVTIGGELADLKSAVSSATGNRIIDMVKNAQIANSGAMLDLNGITTRSGRNCAILECSAGDIFTINGTSGTALRLYAFYNANDPPQLIDGTMAPANAIGNNTQIIAPNNAKYLAINDISGTAVSYYGELLVKRVNDLESDSKQTVSDLIGLTEIAEWTYGAAYRYSNGKVDASSTSSGTFDCVEIACAPGDVFTLSCNSATLAKAYYFIDSDRNILTIGENQTYNNKIIIAPPGTAHLIVNKYKTNTNKCYSGAFIPTNYPTNLNINKNLTGNENMMWVGWCYPSAQSFERVRNKLYFGYTTGDGFTGIGEYDFDTERFTKTHLKKGQIDNHNASAVHVFADGTIVCGYASGHNYDNSMHVRISTQPECIETFGDDISLECSGVTSYCQFIEYNSVLYMFYRVNDIRWVYRQSTDKGKTWSEETLVLQSTAGLKYYCLFTPTTTAGMVRMTMYSNPTASSTDYPNGDSRIRMGFLNLSNGKIYNADGSTEVQDTAWTSFDILIDNETNTLNRLRDVAVSDMSRPMILYTVFNGTADGIYKLYDAGNTVTIASAGAEYLSTTQLGTSWIGTDKIVVIRGIVENGVSKDSVEIWGYSNGSVAQQETVYQEERGGIPIRNMMPIVDVNGKAFLWARGFHKSSGADRFTNFNTDAKIHVLS